jgi:hypothetical protein
VLENRMVELGKKTLRVTNPVHVSILAQKSVCDSRRRIFTAKVFQILRLKSVFVSTEVMPTVLN